METQKELTKYLRNCIGNELSVYNLSYKIGEPPTFTTKNNQYTFSFHYLEHGYSHSISLSKINSSEKIIIIVDGRYSRIHSYLGQIETLKLMMDDVKDEVLYNKKHNVAEMEMSDDDFWSQFMLK